MYFPLFVGVLCLSLCCYALLYVHSSFAIILKRKRKQVVLLRYCYYKCSAALFLKVPWVGLQCVIVIFPDHTHLLFMELRHGTTIYIVKIFLYASRKSEFDQEMTQTQITYRPTALRERDTFSPHHSLRIQFKAISNQPSLP